MSSTVKTVGLSGLASGLAGASSVRVAEELDGLMSIDADIIEWFDGDRFSGSRSKRSAPLVRSRRSTLLQQSGQTSVQAVASFVGDKVGRRNISEQT